MSTHNSQWLCSLIQTFSSHSDDVFKAVKSLKTETLTTQYNGRISLQHKSNCRVYNTSVVADKQWSKNSKWESFSVTWSSLNDKLHHLHKGSRLFTKSSVTFLKSTFSFILHFGTGTSLITCMTLSKCTPRSNYQWLLKAIPYKKKNWEILICFNPNPCIQSPLIFFNLILLIPICICRHLCSITWVGLALRSGRLGSTACG